MKYRKFIKIATISLALLALAFFSIISIRTIGQAVITPDSIINLNDGWTIYSKGQLINTTNPSKADIGSINESEVVTLSRTLPDVGFDNPCLTFISSHALVNVYLGEDLIYSYGQDFYDKYSLIPKKNHYISLSNEYQGKTLKIELTGGRKSAFTTLSDVYIGERIDILSFDFSYDTVSILIGAFLFTFALILIIVSPYLFVFHSNDMRILFSGLISLMLGVYILAYYRVFDLLLDNSIMNAYLEYGSLYSIPIFITGYLMSIYTGKIKKVFIIMFVINMGLFITSAILHISHTLRLSEFTFIMHIAAGIEFAVSVFFIAQDFFEHKKDGLKTIYAAENIFVFGLVIFMLLSIFDIIIYSLRKYTAIPGSTSSSLIGFTFGALIFVICLMVSYLYYSIFSSNIASMQSKIKDLAYTDALTGLSNRARCEQLMQMISEEHGIYAIISLDLNRLKYTNDTLGHHEGDRLLTGFATILSDCFWDASLVGRMGGDEFIVILMEDRTLNLTKRIHEFYAMIADWNHKEQVFQYSASYGYAYSYEVPNGSANEVYMLADNRMYEMKREHHEKNDQEVMSNA